MSKVLSTSNRSMQSSTQVRMPFLTNPFGKHFSYYSKHNKAPPGPVHHKVQGPLVSVKSLRSFSPISINSSIDGSSRMSLTNRSGSTTGLQKINLSISSIIIDRRKMHMRNRSENFK